MTYPFLTQYSTSWRLHERSGLESFSATADALPPSNCSSLVTPAAGVSGVVMRRTIAKISCGANIFCGDRQKTLAYPTDVARSKRMDANPVASAIGRNIDSAITRLGINYTQLGLAWGATRQTVQHWVKGTALPPASDLPRLCELLAIDANELLSVAPRALLHGDQLETHRRWLLQQASASRAAQHEETARKAPRKSPTRRIGQASH